MKTLAPAAMSSLAAGSMGSFFDTCFSRMVSPSPGAACPISAACDMAASSSEWITP